MGGGGQQSDGGSGTTRLTQRSHPGRERQPCPPPPPGPIRGVQVARGVSRRCPQMTDACWSAVAWVSGPTEAPDGKSGFRSNH